MTIGAEPVIHDPWAMANEIATGVAVLLSVCLCYERGPGMSVKVEGNQGQQERGPGLTLEVLNS